MSDLVRKVHAHYKASTRALSGNNGVDFKGWLKEAEGWYKIIAGEQWGRTDYLEMKNLERPALTFNRVGVMVDVVAGLELQNRYEPSFFPFDQADGEVTDSRKAEYLNAILKWVRHNAEMDDEESTAFVDLLTSGMGWTLSTMDYSEDLDGNIEKMAVDPLRCRWDPSCNRKNLKGAKWRMYIMDMSREDVKRRWGKEDFGTDGPWNADIENMHGAKYVLADQQWKYDKALSPTSGEIADDNVHVCLYQYCKYKTVYRVKIDGKGYNLSSKEFKEREEDILSLGYPYVKQEMKEIWRSHIVGDVVLDDVKTLSGGYTLNCMTGKYDKSNKCFYGLVRPMADPQRWANKFISSILDIVAANAKGGIMAEVGAFANERKAEEEWARNDKIAHLNSGGIGKVLPKPVSPLPPGIQYLLEYTTTMFPHTSGISQELMGLVGKDQPGVLEYQRKQAGMSILAWAFNALKSYRKQDAKLIMEIVRGNMSDGRMFMINGDAGPEMAQIIRDEIPLEYDVVVDESPTSPNNAERIWNMMIEIVPTLVDIGVPVPPDIIKYSPLPEELKIKWLQYIQQGTGEEEEEEQLTPVDMATIEEKQAKAKKDEAQARLTSVKARVESHLAGVKTQEAETNRTKARTEASAKEIQMIKDLAEARLKDAQAAAASRVDDNDQERG